MINTELFVLIGLKYPDFFLSWIVRDFCLNENYWTIQNLTLSLSLQDWLQSTPIDFRLRSLDCHFRNLDQEDDSIKSSDGDNMWRR